MTERVDRYRSWSSCDECGFQGLLEFAHRNEENYDDPESLGVMLDATCPACDHQAAVLRRAFDAKRFPTAEMVDERHARLGCRAADDVHEA